MSSSHMHAPKVGHRKSRNGCLTCKRRRVKCDEQRQVCGNCSRLGMECRWPGRCHREPLRSPLVSHEPSAEEATIEGSAGLAGPIPRAPPDGDSVFSAILRRWPVAPVENTIFASRDWGDTGDDTDLPESKARRLLEHRLMHNYYLNILNPFPVSPSEDWSLVWSRKVPMLAMQYDSLLYAVLSASATNMLRDHPGDVELFAARQRYLISAMREQRKLVASLTAENADAVCFSALQILVNSFAMLRERNLEPYEPPMDWLRMGRGAGTVIWMSVGEILKAGDTAASSMMIVADSYPRFGRDESYFDPEMRQAFEGILTQKLPSGDTWDDATREAYEKAVSYVGSMQKAIDRGEPVYAICRRIQAFALVMPPRYIDMVTEQRPRALIVLAHFFATVAQVRGVWWLGQSADGEDSMAKREIRAIGKTVAKEWQSQMIWPMDMVGLHH